MAGRLIGLLLASITVGVQAQTRLAGFGEPMHFHDIGAACSGNSGSCSGYLLARGQITPETPRAFEIAIRGRKFSKTVMFDSPGGNVMAAMELGRLIRRHGYITVVGEDYTELGARLEENTLVEKGRCFSACVYAFMGGVGRIVDGAGQLGLHQMRGTDVGLSEGQVQVTMAVLGQYVEEMGLDRRIVDIASVVPPQRMQIVSADLAKELLLDNSEPPLRAWELKANGEGELALIVTQQLPVRAAATTVVLTIENERLVVRSRHAVSQNFYSIAEMRSIFSGSPEIELVIDDETFKATFSADWVAESAGTYRTGAVFDRSVKRRLERARTLRINFASFGKPVADVDPSVRLSTEGLASGLPALQRSAGVRH